MKSGYWKTGGMSLLALALQWSTILAFSTASGHHHTLFGLPF